MSLFSALFQRKSEEPAKDDVQKNKELPMEQMLTSQLVAF